MTTVDRIMELVDTYTDTFMGYGNPEARAAMLAALQELTAALDAPEVEPPWEAAERVDNGGQP